MLDKLFGEIDSMEEELGNELDASGSDDTEQQADVEPERAEGEVAVEQLAQAAVVSAQQKKVKKYAPTVFGRDVKLDGDIYAEHDMILDGHVEGNVECGGTLTLRGRVAGDVDADKMIFYGAKVKGNIHCKGMLSMDEDTVLAGDIETGTLELNGKGEGSIKVRGHASVHSMAYVLGDLDVGGFNAEKGAYINGRITIHGDESIRIVHEELSGLSAAGGKSRWPRRSAANDMPGAEHREPGGRL